LTIEIGRPVIASGRVTNQPQSIITTDMNKAELVAEVQKSLGADTSKAAAERAVEAVLEGVKKGVKKDKNVQLIGFGTFSVTKRAAREGINPQTGEKIKIKASKAVKFKAGAGLKSVL
jgi:nucleoid DNA-binding protein